ncbi:hypothetical protein [Helicobacter valdiviensis]|nr:hypothetical protein [Helicobacter valdiviensis]
MHCTSFVDNASLVWGFERTACCPSLQEEALPSCEVKIKEIKKRSSPQA